ncbi:hypothetical protein GCM10027051_15810 [Niabella terrae]
MQKKQHIVLYSRKAERLLLVLVTLILAAMCFSYLRHIRSELALATGGYRDHTVINLRAPLPATAVRNALKKGGYFAEDAYIGFVTDQLKTIVDGQTVLPNLGALNKAPLLVDAKIFQASGTQQGKLRFFNALARLGMDSATWHQETGSKQPPVHTASGTEATGTVITGRVRLADESGAEQAGAGILVRLTRLYPDAFWDSLSDRGRDIQTEFETRTDDKGHYRFAGLDPQGNYSVLALKPGYSFGTAKGKARIGSDRDFNFTGQIHKIRLLDRTAYKQIKEDQLFTVRTPDEFRKLFFTALILLVLAAWILHLALYLKNYRSDEFLLPLILFILGIGVMVLFSTQDPLRDEVYGSGMALCGGAVMLVFALLIFLLKNNPVNRFYQGHYFDPLHRLLSAGHAQRRLKAPRGYSWLLASILLMLLLAVLGTGPQGSGVKVNLFGFQVSELSKFLMVVFFAAYFTANAGYFKNITDNRWLTRNNLLMFGFFVFLLLIYAVLGDLGPAIVLCLTFLFFYAFAKKEFGQMILAAIGYGLLIFIVYRFLNTPEQDYLPWLALIACVGSLAYAWWAKKLESVFFILLIMSAFILLAALPFEFTQRLADRNSMFGNIWENRLTGGDQIAQGVWSLNAGGFTGQGLGQGFSNLMPAHHTDMILQSIGEELGILTLICIFTAFGLLIYRCLLAARRTAKTFMFYFMAGVAIATMLQLLLIAAGTLGLVPLTGISVPLLSKGNAGVIITLIALLLVLVMSHEKGDALEMEYMKENFDNVNAYAILSFFAAVLLITGSLIYYQVKSNQYIVKPALVLNRMGDWQYTYNPRISMLLKDIDAGDIYDRNGVLLATSDKLRFDSSRQRLLALGANPVLYKEQLSRDQKRYYPFGADMLFWLGDYNKEIAKEPASGYAAEYRHYTSLRGFDVHYTTTIRTTDRYREHRFLPEQTKETELMRYDYADLAPFLKAGKRTEGIEQQNNKKKDVWLTLDLALNEQINALVQSRAPYKDYRTSVIAVNSRTGDVLASASNPAASYRDMKLISDIDPVDYRSIYLQLFGDQMVLPQDLGITFASRPGSVIKIVDSYAAFNQYGLSAADFRFYVYPAEVIRPGEPSGQDVNMRTAIVRSSNVYFIKLINEKKLESSLFHMYDLLGMNIANRGGFNFSRPEDYDSQRYIREWQEFTARGKSIYQTRNKKLINTRRRFQSHYSDLAWGQGELMATPLHLAKMSAAIAAGDSLRSSRFLLKSWNQPEFLEPAQVIAQHPGSAALMKSFMKEQSAGVSTLTGLEVYGKTGSPERDKLVHKGRRTSLKRVTDAWYTFFVYSPRYKAPLAFTIRIEEIGNSDAAKKLAVDLLGQLKSTGYF